MPSFAEHPIISGVIASILFALIVAGYNNWSNRVDPEEEVRKNSEEIMRRVASAESLLRNSCILPKPAIVSAYSMLQNPGKDTTFKMETFLKPDLNRLNQNIFDLSHNLVLSAKEVNVLHPHLARDNAVKIRNVSQSIKDNFNPAVLLTPGVSVDQLEKIRLNFRQTLLGGYGSLFFDVEFRKFYNEGLVEAGMMTQFVADVLSHSESFDSNNEGYWWSACNEDVKLCFKVIRAEISRRFPTTNGTENIMANLHMSQMFAFFIKSRKVPLELSDSNAPEDNANQLVAHKNLFGSEIGKCKALFRTLYPSNIPQLAQSGLASTGSE